MGVFEARGTLAKSLKDLSVRWQEAKANWEDHQAELFEKQVLEPLQQDLRLTATAMDSLATLLGNCRNECGPD